MIEGFFGKMTHQMLRGIRVNSKEELANRIYKYFEEVNETPVDVYYAVNRYANAGQNPASQWFELASSCTASSFMVY